MTLLSLAKDFTFFDASGISGLGFLLVLSVLAFLAILVLGFSKIFSKIKKTDKKPESVAQTSEPTAAPEVKETSEVIEETAEEPEYPYTPGYVTLDGISEQDAAVIMAITSNKTGIPLENLAFNSIKLVEE